MVSKIKNQLTKIIYAALPLFFPAKKTVKHSEVGICTLLCHNHVDFLIYNLMSLFTSIGKPLPIYIVDDGTLNSSDYQKLRRYFTVIIEPVNSTARKTRILLKKYQNIFKFRFDKNTTPLKQKLDSILTSPFSRSIYIDADILFFEKAPQISKWIDTNSKINYYSAHLPYPKNFFGRYSETLGHSYRSLLFKHFSINIDPTFNSGLLLINKSSLDLHKLDRIFKYFFDTLYAYDILAEETSFAFIINDFIYKKLPVDKYVNAWCIEEYNQIFSDKIVSLHYSGPLKNYQLRLKKDSIKLAFKQNFFKNK